MDELLTLFGRIGIPEDKAKETSTNKKMSQSLSQLIHTLKADVSWNMGSLIYELASLHMRHTELLNPHIPLLVEKVQSGEWRTKDQVLGSFHVISHLIDDQL
jgi:hypothetical protein